jgi:hypothetical protein
MRRTIEWALVVVLALSTTGAGCDEDNDTGQIELSPLEILFTFPEDARSGVRTPAGVQSVSVDFNRPPTQDPRFLIAPDPVTPGTLTPSATGRSWGLVGLELVADAGAYWWVIDAPELEEPQLIHIAMTDGERAALMGFSGVVTSADTTQVRPQGAVVFAVATGAGFNPLDPSTFLALDWEGLAVASRGRDNGRAEYACGYMAPLAPVVVLAIADSNNDQVYDPTADWWGFYQATGAPGSPAPVVADLPDGPESQRNDAVVITLRAP